MNDKPLIEDAVRTRLDAAAQRALAEAEARHAQDHTQESHTQDINRDRAREMGGVAGPEPTRFGDWEKKGLICDF